MIQFNLLPDVKIQFIKTRYRKRLVILIASLVTTVFLVIFVLMFLYVRVNQKVRLRSLDKQVTNYSSEIKQVDDLDKILTIQNQLNSLPGLHDKKTVSSRLPGYLTKVTPKDATISNVDVDFTTNKIVLKGNAPDLVTVNKYTDSLKYTDYKINGLLTQTNEKDKSGKAFKSVVLTAFSIPSNVNGFQGAQSSYTITFEFEPAIFQKITDTQDGKEAITLSVPDIISTSSETQKPIFKEDKNTGGAQ